MSDDRFDVDILGKKVGTADGCDGKGLCWSYSNFQPDDFSIFPDLGPDLGGYDAVYLHLSYDTGDVKLERPNEFGIELIILFDIYFQLKEKDDE